MFLARILAEKTTTKKVPVIYMKGLQVSQTEDKLRVFSLKTCKRVLIPHLTG